MQFIFDNTSSIRIEMITASRSQTFPSGVSLQDYSIAVRNNLQGDGGDDKTYKFTVAPPIGLTYSENRDLLEDLYFNQQTSVANINLSNNSGMAYITAELGGILGDAFSNVDSIYTQANSVFVLKANESGIDYNNQHLSKEYEHYSYITIRDSSGLSNANISTYAGNVALEAGTWLQMVDEYNTGNVLYGMEKPFRLLSNVVFRADTSHPLTSVALPGKNMRPDGRDNVFYDRDLGILVDRIPKLSNKDSASNPKDTEIRIKRDNVTFLLKPIFLPNYSITPHDIIEFDGDFVFMEETLVP